LFPSSPSLFYSSFFFSAIIGQFHFIWIYSFFFENFPEGEKWVNEILSKIPDAVPVLYIAGYVYRKQGKLDEAERVFNLATKHSTEVKQMQRFGDYEQGYCSYLKLNYANAIETLTRFLNGKNLLLLSPFLLLSFLSFLLSIKLILFSSKIHPERVSVVTQPTNSP
jgi:tetratricopeptide (TPR) repeat protein